jgi:ribosomal-protein-alanine N-acetyltransferase
MWSRPLGVQRCHSCPESFPCRCPGIVTNGRGRDTAPIATAEPSLSDPLPWSAHRVTLRRLRPADLPEFQAYRHDAEVGRYQGWEPVPDEDALRFLTEMSQAPFGRPGEWLQIAIADAGDDSLMGDIGLFTMAAGREAEFGITLARAAQGRGLAEEAARTLIDGLRERTAVRRVIAITDVRNVASARLLRRLGMTLEAEASAEFRGEPCREWHFSLVL